MFVTLKCLRSLNKCSKCSTFLGLFIIIRGKIQTYMTLFEKVMHPPSIAVAAAKRVAQSVIRLLGSNQFLLFTWLAVVKGFHLTMEMIL